MSKPDPNIAAAISAEVERLGLRLVDVPGHALENGAGRALLSRLRTLRRGEGWEAAFQELPHHSSPAEATAPRTADEQAARQMERAESLSRWLALLGDLSPTASAVDRRLRFEIHAPDKSTAFALASHLQAGQSWVTDARPTFRSAHRDAVIDGWQHAAGWVVVGHTAEVSLRAEFAALWISALLSASDEHDCQLSYLGDDAPPPATGKDDAPTDPRPAA